MGGTATVELKASEAYGTYITEAVITVQKSEFPKDMKYDLNGFIQGKDNEGRPVQGQVIKIEENTEEYHRV